MIPRYKLRTLLIVLALGPPLLAGGWWGYGKWRADLRKPPAMTIQQQSRILVECVKLDDTWFDDMMAQRAAEEAAAKAWSDRVDEYHRKRREVEAAQSQPPNH